MPWFSSTVPVQAKSREAFTELLEAPRQRNSPGSCQWTQFLFLTTSPRRRAWIEVPTVFTSRISMQCLLAQDLVIVNGKQWGTEAYVSQGWDWGGPAGGGECSGQLSGPGGCGSASEAWAATREGQRELELLTFFILNIGLLVWLLISCNTDLLFSSEILALLPWHPQVT